MCEIRTATDTDGNVIIVEEIPLTLTPENE